MFLIEVTCFKEVDNWSINKQYLNQWVTYIKSKCAFTVHQLFAISKSKSKNRKARRRLLVAMRSNDCGRSFRHNISPPDKQPDRLLSPVNPSHSSWDKKCYDTAYQQLANADAIKFPVTSSIQQI